MSSSLRVWILWSNLLKKLLEAELQTGPYSVAKCFQSCFILRILTASSSQNSHLILLLSLSTCLACQWAWKALVTTAVTQKPRQRARCLEELSSPGFCSSALAVPHRPRSQNKNSLGQTMQLFPSSDNAVPLVLQGCTWLSQGTSGHGPRWELSLPLPADLFRGNPALQQCYSSAPSACCCFSQPESPILPEGVWPRAVHPREQDPSPFLPAVCQGSALRGQIGDLPRDDAVV